VAIIIINIIVFAASRSIDSAVDRRRYVIRCSWTNLSSKEEEKVTAAARKSEKAV
jgi:hypothetical protein